MLSDPPHTASGSPKYWSYYVFKNSSEVICVLNWLQDKKTHLNKFYLFLSARDQELQPVSSELIFSIRVYQNLNSVLINDETAATLSATYLGDLGIGRRVKNFHW